MHHVHDLGWLTFTFWQIVLFVCGARNYQSHFSCILGPFFTVSYVPNVLVCLSCMLNFFVCSKFDLVAHHDAFAWTDTPKLFA